MVGRQLVHHGPPTTHDALWTSIQTVWRQIPKGHIQALFDSIPRRLEALIAGMNAWHHTEISRLQIMRSQ